MKFLKIYFVIRSDIFKLVSIILHSFSMQETLAHELSLRIFPIFVIVEFSLYNKD